ncbi:hypothetical protein GUJ93_ZPchr0003g16541 [Zizania palustris]|uniref:OTU domain-containing protein n=1 Tax=Zizania palustris TaxID=103762 RepID=A0A8J5SUG9_ZIZPA|nr:hypothetical protein GUJ93_ZPchr0003g16541 [Zizania palustris]KAG8061930.1 hypothetical protein GUJ93_ZPchr0003g16541 [Zizania palustris]
MAVCDHDDPLLVRWGLQHLLPHQPADRCSCARPDPGSDLSHQRGNGGDVLPQGASVENDEIIAHALQEELSQVALAEASGSSHSTHASTVLTQHWFRPSIAHHLPPSAPPLKHEDYDEEEAQAAAETMEPSSSCSSPGDNTHDGQECLIEIVDDFSALDGQVGERLNDMVPIPHVPKTNGEIPSVDEAFSDHQRLVNRLVLYDLVELKVKGDGNCQFRALSDQFYRTTEHHRFVRQQIVKQGISQEDDKRWGVG